jgi:hypothetical protein
MVDMGERYWIDRWVVKSMGSVTGWTSPDYNMNSYTLQGSVDGASWDNIDSVAGNTLSQTDRTFSPVYYRYVRLYVTSGLNCNKQLAACMEFEVYEAAGTSSLLSSLAISSGIMTPAFSPSTITYSASVTDAAIEVTPTALDSNAAILVNGTTVASGQGSAQIPLNIGSNQITIVVSASRGTSTTTYRLNITREKNLYLQKVDLNYKGRGFSKTQTITMDHTIVSYSDQAPSQATGVTVTPYAEDTVVSICVNGQNISSGGTSSQINLNASTAISLIVTYPGDTSGRAYTVTITKS